MSLSPALLFLDCEFTSLKSPALLSLALSCEKAAHGELYLELDLSCAEFQALRPLANDFVKAHVLPLMGMPSLAESRCESLAELGTRLAAWLEVLLPAQTSASPGPSPYCVSIAYDYHADFDLLEAALRAAGKWSHWEGLLSPVHVAYVWGDPDACHAAQSCWEACTNGSPSLLRHHALADARALRQAFLAVHG